MSFRIIRPGMSIRKGVNDPLGITLMSDLHIGAVNTDTDAIVRDLKEAAAHGDRININGDVFDAILPKDTKRYRPEALHPDLRGRSDVLNGAVDMAYELLAPYAKLIDMIGWGNHEAVVAKYHGVDPLSVLIARLRARGSKVEHGGYTGFIDYRVKVGRNSTTFRLVIYYHHGSGGSAPVTRGMIDFARKQQWVDADVIWLGHKHNRLVDSTPQRLRCPLSGIEPDYDPQLCIMTGAYMTPYVGQSGESVDKGGYVSTYASEIGYAPQSKGGSRVLVWLSTTTATSGIRRIQVLN